VSRSLVERVDGPLAPFVAGLDVELRGRGYSSERLRRRLRLLLELDRWMVGGSVELARLNAETIEAAVAAAPAPGRWGSPASRRDLLAFLRDRGLVERPVAPEPSPLERLVGAFVAYLVRERGLSESSTSVYWYRRIATAFLADRVDPDTGALGAIVAGDASRFMLSECRSCSRWTGMRLVVGLRGLLRFLFLEGLVERDLTGAVPRVAAWSLVSLPKALAAGDAARIVASCDRSTRVGRRDFAVLMLLARMGLRGCEVTRMHLDDIDWHAGEVIVRGKREHDERLPLPVDVGEAIADYLQHVRPRSADRHVFLAAVAPFGPLSGGEGSIGRIVRNASDRAGLPRVGVHRLRHTVATEALKAGAPLEEIASLLRHREHATTVGYVKVDWERLRELARPWPAGGRS